MYYYIHSYSGWHEVNRAYYREFVTDLERELFRHADRDDIIAMRTRKSERPLTIIDLVTGVTV